MELLNTDLISEHFLTLKIFKSMKFVSHCSSILKVFHLIFKESYLLFKKTNTPETDALQETILSLHLFWIIYLCQM